MPTHPASALNLQQKPVEPVVEVNIQKTIEISKQIVESTEKEEERKKKEKKDKYNAKFWTTY